MKGCSFTGSHKREESCRSLEDLDVLAQRAVLPTQPPELGPLLSSQAGALTLADLSLLYPAAHVRLGQIEVSGHLADAAIAATAQLDDLRLELRSERPARARLLPLHGLHFGHPLWGRAPDGGCPSNRGSPPKLRSLDHQTEGLGQMDLDLTRQRTHSNLRKWTDPDGARRSRWDWRSSDLCVE